MAEDFALTFDGRKAVIGQDESRWMKPSYMRWRKSTSLKQGMKSTSLKQGMKSTRLK
jgi:hypothetical protein